MKLGLLEHSWVLLGFLNGSGMVCCTCCGIVLVSFCMILLPDKGDKIRHPCNFGRELMGMVITFFFHYYY